MLGKRLKDLREMNFWTQKYIADQVGISQRVYSNYENDERSVPIDILIKFSYLYNASIDYMLGLTDVKEPYPRRKK